MVVSRALLIIIILAIAACAGSGVWLIAQSGRFGEEASGSATPGSPSGDEARKRAQEFFGGKKEYDLTGGQEMKPRW